MIKYHDNVVQGSDEWYEMRRGVLTASEMKLIITPTFKMASNDKERSHLYELMAQRITKYVEPTYISDDMLRGIEDEATVRQIYAKAYAREVKEVGFVTNDNFGFTIGYSPDGLVGDDGLIETKSRRQKHQIETILDFSEGNKCPEEYMIQVQTGFLVTDRKWCDFISYHGGLPMATIRVYPDAKIQQAILEAATAFEIRLADKMAKYAELLLTNPRLVKTERRIEQEISAS